MNNLILIALLIVILVLLLTREGPPRESYFLRRPYIDPATLAEAGESEMNDI